MLQQPTPDDFVLATGETHPVREFIEKSFNALDIQLRFAYLSLIRSPLPFDIYVSCCRWSGKGLDEQAMDVKSGKIVVKVDTKYFRPAEVECVMGFTSSLFSNRTQSTFADPPAPQHPPRKSCESRTGSRVETQSRF